MRNIKQIISSAMELAKSQKLSSNPHDACALPKLEHREMKTLTADQLASFLREARRAASTRCTIGAGNGPPPGRARPQVDDIDLATASFRLRP